MTSDNVYYVKHNLTSAGIAHLASPLAVGLPHSRRSPPPPIRLWKICEVAAHEELPFGRSGTPLDEPCAHRRALWFKKGRSLRERKSALRLGSSPPCQAPEQPVRDIPLERTMTRRAWPSPGSMQVLGDAPVRSNPGLPAGHHVTPESPVKAGSHYRTWPLVSRLQEQPAEETGQQHRRNDAVPHMAECRAPATERWTHIVLLLHDCGAVGGNGSHSRKGSVAATAHESPRFGLAEVRPRCAQGRPAPVRATRGFPSCIPAISSASPWGLYRSGRTRMPCTP